MDGDVQPPLESAATVAELGLLVHSVLPTERSQDLTFYPTMSRMGDRGTIQSSWEARSEEPVERYPYYNEVVIPIQSTTAV